MYHLFNLSTIKTTRSNNQAKDSKKLANNHNFTQLKTFMVKAWVQINNMKMKEWVDNNLVPKIKTEIA